jgi:hypothetical protein
MVLGLVCAVVAVAGRRLIGVPGCAA